ncbi:MAG: DUF6600 domain-containing protein [Methylosarcina sp.]
MNARFSSGLVPRLLLPVVLLFCLLPARPAQAYHTRDGAADMFYQALAPYGNWVHHRSYGRVWYPKQVPRDWRPYTDGYWSYTNNYGWLWVSDWVWGWAPFHYGRWVWDDWYGWVWVPGTLWAPAWVFWQYGGGYLSWAPMPPQYIWNPYISYSTSYFNYDRYVNWDSWVFVRDRDFPRRHRPRRLIAPDHNRELLKSTRRIDHMTVINNNIVNQGVPLNHIEQATGRRIKPAAPRIMTQSEWRNEDHRRGRVGQEPIIYRPIDIRPSPDVVRQEEQYARQFLERAPAAGERAIERNQLEKNPLPRLPGRLSGKPMPLDYLESQEPAAVPPQIQQPSAPLWTLPERREDLPLKPGINRNTQRRESIDRAREPQQLELERQQRAEEERMQRESIRQQKEADRRRQLELERQRQSEQDRLQRESAHQQIKSTRRQQQELERQRQDEQRRMERESSQQQERNRQQEQQPYRRQPGELQQQIEQQQRARDEARQIEKLNRQQEKLYRQPPIQRQQQIELQQQNEEAQRVREGLRPQREIIQQPNIQQQPMPQQMDGQPQPDQSGGGRSGRSLSRGQRSR